MESSSSIKELVGALAKAQLAFLPIKQTEKVDYPGKEGRPGRKYNYAPLSNVLDACRKALSANDLAIMQPIKMLETHLVVETLLAHSSGEWIKSEIIIDSIGKDPQAIGSALTYARRYALSALLGVASEEDDDAKGATEEEEEKAKVKRTILAFKPILPKETEGKEHWCAEDNVPFTEKTDKDGKHWWSHRKADGTWCNENKGKAQVDTTPVTRLQSAVIGEQIGGKEDWAKLDTEVDDIIQQLNDVKWDKTATLNSWLSSFLKIPMADLAGKTLREVIEYLNHDGRLALCNKLNGLAALR